MTRFPFLSHHWQKKLPRAILFDHDGVLVASEPLHWAAWRKLLEQIGIPYREEDVAAHVGKTAPKILAALLDQYRPGWNPKDYDLNALSLKKNDFYLVEAAAHLHVYPGVKEGLAELKKRNVKMAVVSNARSRELRAGLEAVKLSEYFDAIVSRDEAKLPKPDPTPYLLGAASLQSDPSECLAIEDSPPGLESALFAKIPAVGVLTNFNLQDLKSPVPGRPDLQPLLVVHQIRDFFEFILN